ncbi:uncharacterized protein LOC116919937, partial [Daphnia magna]|uniref:uncharacterized protein LOC116919937 n=1 Tax=Daphnia magna TaxID=35525 RepID=UPI001E1BB239
DANIKTKHLVCNLHFASGKPSYYLQKNHPDWAPSLSLNKAITDSTRLQRRVLYTYNREAMFMNTLANYTQRKKEDNSNITKDSVLLPRLANYQNSWKGRIIGLQHFPQIPPRT